MSAPVLSVCGLGRRYGALAAVDDVSFDVRPGVRLALIGPNGAGKSTLFDLISGETRPTSGQITLAGKDVTRSRSAARARLGIGKTFQRSRLFDDMTVAENVGLACARAKGIGRRWWRSLADHTELTSAIHANLEQTGLAHRRNDLAGSLSHGEQRQLEVGLALALSPTLLLLDEPTAAMSVGETAGFMDRIARLPRQVTVLIIEHDLDVVFGLAEEVIVMSAGRLIAHGSPHEIRGSSAVQDAYLGVDYDDELFLEEQR